MGGYEEEIAESTSAKINRIRIDNGLLSMGELLVKREGKAYEDGVDLDGTNG